MRLVVQKSIIFPCRLKCIHGNNKNHSLFVEVIKEVVFLREHYTLNKLCLNAILFKIQFFFI